MCKLPACIPVALMLLIAAPAAALNGFDLTVSLVDRFAIEFGGQPRDGIPAIEAPHFVAAPAAKHVSAQDRVLGLFAFGEAKAYPFVELRAAEARTLLDRFAGRDIFVQFDAQADTARAYAVNGTELPATLSYWFAWFSFYPDTAVFEAP